MKLALDTSVIVSALDGSDPDHAACRTLLLSAKFAAWSHALTETFSTLTGGRLGIRISPPVAASILREKVAPRLATTSLTESELLDSYENAEAHCNRRAGKARLCQVGNFPASNGWIPPHDNLDRILDDG